ncbi:MAG: glycerol dehydrogenase [Clostridia bacterium]|nr:glycerol dehydrogenase [Clostridia bacterium]
MAQIIGSPNRYVQGMGLLGELGDYTAKYGKKPLLILSKGGQERFGKALGRSFEQSGCPPETVIFNGECSQREIDRIKGLAAEKGADVLVGVGGGKIIDTTKAAAYYAGSPCLVMPTLASSDAPCSSLSVVYTDDHRFESYLYLPAGPDMVLMDTGIIAQAPPRLLASGMGDALATYFEARACQQSHSKNCLGGNVTLAAMGIAELCYGTLMSDGLKAILAASAEACTPALEAIVEANTYLSGIGFESGGLALAHAIHNGLTVLPGTHDLYHGEKVAFGTLTQLVMENADEEELQHIFEFCITMGLPVTFAELGLEDVTAEELLKAAEAAAAPDDTAHNMPFPVSAQSILNGMVAADALGHFYLGDDGEEGCGCGHDHSHC